MGKASSSKKVARAARAGQSGGTSERRELGFPLAIIAIVLLGIGLVVFARANRDEASSPRLSDHWHSAYGVYQCDADGFLDPFASTYDPDGIHSHSDGLIHIHPFTSGVTGEDAQLEVFLDAMQVQLDADTLTLTDGTQIPDGPIECDGEVAVWQVARWSDAGEVDGDPDEIITQDFAAVRFENDGEAFTIALAPLGADIPPPPSAADVPNADDDRISEGPVDELGEAESQSEATDEGDAPATTEAGTTEP